MSQIKLITNSFSSTAYNKVVDHPLQSWQWGEVRQNLGTKIIRVGEFNQDKIISSLLMTVHPIPKTSFKIGYVPRSIWPSKRMISFLVDYAKENGLVFIKFEPDIHLKNFDKNNCTKEKNIRKSAHPLFPNWTQVLDISETEEELLKKMKSKTRYNIRLAKKKGVLIKEESNEKGFAIFKQLYFETCKRQKYYGHDEQYHQQVWQALKDKFAHILVAYYQEKPLAVYELFLFKDKLYYPYGGSSIEHKNVMAANLIMWEAILFGKKNGAKLFDMWGSTGPDYNKHDPYAGFTRFKEGYGTEFVQMAGSYDLVINPFLYSIYGVIYKVRNWLMTI